MRKLTLHFVITLIASFMAVTFYNLFEKPAEDFRNNPFSHSELYQNNTKVPNIYIVDGLTSLGDSIAYIVEFTQSNVLDDNPIFKGVGVKQPSSFIMPQQALH